MVEGVPYTEAHLHWAKVRPLLERCLQRFDTGYLAEDILTEIQLRKKQLWLIDGGRAAAVTAIVVLPRWKKLVVEFLAGGGMDKWLRELQCELECYAEAMGCKYIETSGRKGWMRACKGDEMIFVGRKRVG